MIYTIGHSTLDQAAFLKLIEPVETVIDIRSHPSSKWPWFAKDSMQQWLPTAGKKYEWCPDLGGWAGQHAHLASGFERHGVDVLTYAKGKFPKQRIAKGRQEGSQQTFFWTNQGLYDYSWFTTLPEFNLAAKDLMRRGFRENVGIMCCELLWWKCHRSMVADWLVFHGGDATHLQPKLTQHSGAIGNRLQRYDPEIKKIWACYT